MPNWVIILTLFAEFAISAALIVMILRLLKGINITVNVMPQPPTPKQTEASTAHDLVQIQVELDKLEEQRRNDQQQLEDLVSNINSFMMGGTTDGQK